MISFLIQTLRNGVHYARAHHNLLLVAVLILVAPLLLWHTNYQHFLAAERNAERSEKNRIGLMHDVLVSFWSATQFEPALIQVEIKRLAELNPDIVEFRIAKLEDNEVRLLAALDTALVGTVDANPQFYRNALINPQESLIFEANEAAGRQWYIYRAVLTETGAIYFIYTKVSLAGLDYALAESYKTATYSFIVLYLLAAGIAYWHLRLTDYQYLYQQQRRENQAKDSFMNILAHELRAPLTAIRGYASLLEERVKGKEHEHVVRVRESSERLLSLVNDLLDVARIQSGKLAIEKKRIDVSDLIKQALAESTISSQEKSIKLTSEGTDQEHLIEADAKRLGQVLTNLVNNAIKYTKEGSITVSVEEKFENIEIRVKDTGLGISSEDQQKLFAPFFRVQNDVINQITGSGLGMWITKQLVDLMGGFIAVESIKGVGTHVVLTFKKSAKRP